MLQQSDTNRGPRLQHLQLFCGALQLIPLPLLLSLEVGKKTSTLQTMQKHIQNGDVHLEILEKPVEILDLLGFLEEFISNNDASQRLSETVSSWIVGEVGDYLENLLDADFRNTRYKLVHSNTNFCWSDPHFLA